MGQNRFCKNAPIIPTHLFFLSFNCFSAKLMCVCVNSRNYLWSINSVNQCDRHMFIIIRHLVFQTWGSKSWLFRHEGLNLMCLVLFNLVRGHDLLILFKYYTEIGLQSATVFGIGIRLYNFRSKWIFLLISYNFKALLLTLHWFFFYWRHFSCKFNLSHHSFWSYFGGSCTVSRLTTC